MESNDMAENAKKKFRWRAFASVTTALSFLAVSVTGLVLFVTPTGRVAHWVGWKMLGLKKDQWGGLHIWFGLIFLIAAVCHTALNWGVLLSYFRSRLRKAYALRPEWILALLLAGIVWVGTLANIPPFSSVLILNESIKDSWEVPGQQAPVPHAELMTLQQIADKVDGVDAETMSKNLQAAGISVESPSAILGELADQHHQTPRQIYILAVGEALARSTSQGCYSGRGMGQLTLRQYCQKAELDVSDAVRKLKAEGYRAEPDMQLRDIAHAAGTHVSDLQDVLRP